MLDALERLHREGVFHRDIAPDNIVLTDEGRAVLLDFGAARKVIGDRTHALTAILKPHFAPIEQYADVAAMRQGPWTDLYGLAASVYYLLTGQPPLPAAARALHDELPSLARLQPAGCSPAFLQAVDWALAVRPQHRPQSVAIWRDVLEGRMAVPTVLRQDTTLPAVTSIAVASPQGPTDFDPTEPMGVSGAPETRPGAPRNVAPAAPRAEPQPTRPVPPAAGFRATVDPSWRGFTVPGAEPAHATVPLAPPRPEEPAAGSSPAVGAAALPWHRRTGRLAVLAGGAALLLIGAFVRTIPSPKPTAAAAAAAGASAAAVSASGALAGAPRSQPVEVLVESPPPAAVPPQPLKGGPAVVSPTPAPDASAPSLSGGAARAAARSAPANRERVREHDRSAAPAAHAAVTGPEERCTGHMFLARLICIQRACDSDPRLHSHPECVKLAKAEQERRERMMQH
jgi:hypothetical protein